MQNFGRNKLDRVLRCAKCEETSELISVSISFSLVNVFLQRKNIPLDEQRNFFEEQKSFKIEIFFFKFPVKNFVSKYFFCGDLGPMS